jgi:hypothetical protein
MSNQTVPSVTLQTAVLMQVSEFAKNSQPFSVHDVTVAVRSKASQGELEIPEVEVAGASFRFDIPHSKVKGIFDELWRTGVFDPSFTLNRNFNGMYFEYTPSLNSITAVPPPAAPVTAAPSVQVANPPYPYTATNSLVPDAVVRDRIQTYLKNCATRNFRPTLKQIQSAIKRDVSTGWSCEKIQDYVENLGYNVVANPEYVSASQVVV